MGEVGSEGRRFHEEVGAQARRSDIEHLLSLGELAVHSASAFGSGATHFENMEDLMQMLNAILTPETTVLVKGSRFMQMERVIRQLVNEPKGEAH
jgi:UDP-N-acetylmuramoyl-tripeptide--D-alanyl-D-alanine ligase